MTSEPVVPRTRFGVGHDRRRLPLAVGARLARGHGQGGRGGRNREARAGAKAGSESRARHADGGARGDRAHRYSLTGIER